MEAVLSLLRVIGPTAAINYFKGIAVIETIPHFLLMRVSNDNNQLETNSDVTSYPPRIDSTPGVQYAIFARQ